MPCTNNCCNSAYLIVSADHGGETLDCPISFSVVEEIGFLAIRSGVILGPGCRPPISKDLAAVVECLDLDDDIDAGTKDTLILVLKGTVCDVTITCYNMIRGTTSWNGSSTPFTRQVTFQIEDEMDPAVAAYLKVEV